MALMQLHIDSETLFMAMDVWVLMPEKMPAKDLRAFWFLHGGHGDHSRWVRASSIERDAAEHGIAVIMPGAHNSSFVNMHGWQKYNDYIGGELPGIIRSIFPMLSHKREDNWIGGFSNGGYGSLNVALRHPEVFGAVCAVAAGDKADVDWAGRMKEKAMIFGADTDMHNSEYSLQYLAKQLLHQGRPAPKISHFCGSEDPWLDLNHKVRDFFQTVEGNPFSYSYTEIAGYGHKVEAAENAYRAFFGKMIIKGE